MRSLVVGAIIVSYAIHIVFAKPGDSKDHDKEQDVSSSSDDGNEGESAKPDPGQPSLLNEKIPDSKSPNIKGKLSAIKDRIQQQAYDAAGYVYETAQPIRETLHLHVYHTVGAMHELGAPAREVVENNKHVKGTVIAIGIWQEIREELKNKSPEEKIRVLVDAISKKVINSLPDSTNIQPLEINRNSAFICGAKGLMKDLTTIEKVGSDVIPFDDNSGFKIVVYFKFKDLHFVYNVFFVSIIESVKKLAKKGELDLKFGENIAKITLEIPQFSQILKNLLNTNCVVHVKNFEVTKLEFIHSSLSGRKNSYRRKYLSGQILKYLKNNQEMLRHRFEQRTLVEIHRAFNTQDDWICKDKEFGELVRSKGGSLDSFVASKKFKDNCGEELFIEPYKKTERKI